MLGTVPADLDTKTLARRLFDLAGDERQVQVDFLLHLGEFDARRAYLDAGFPSLWTYCLSVLHLREGAAARRIAAMKVLRQFPRLGAPLRDGRLSISTATLLGPLFTEENLHDLVVRAAFKTKAEVDHLVASLRPRTAPQDGVRKLPQRAEAPGAAADAPPVAPANHPLSPAAGPFGLPARARATLSVNEVRMRGPRRGCRWPPPPRSCSPLPPPRARPPSSAPSPPTSGRSG